MATRDNTRDTNPVAEAVIDEEHKGFPVVWLLPLVAVLVGAWLIYKTVSETGPSITISFLTAEGIQAEKTKIRYRDVEVGKVDSIGFSDDISHILVKAVMEPGSDEFLTEQTRFWVVKPRIGAGGVTGLGTLISGAYIAMEPSQEGKHTKSFTGLEKPPVVTADVEAARAGIVYLWNGKICHSFSLCQPPVSVATDSGRFKHWSLAKT